MREGLGWSQEKLADEAGVSRDVVGRAEQSGNVRLFNLYDIVTALGVSIGQLFVAASAKPPDEKHAELLRLWKAVGPRRQRHVLQSLSRFAGEEPADTRDE